MTTDNNKGNFRENIFLKGWRPYAWITALLIAAHLWSVNFGYVYFDDDSLIINNRRQLEDIKSIPAAFTGELERGSTPFYRPLLQTSFILNNLIGGPAARGFHIFNIILHLTACLLFFEFLKRLGISPPGALLGCLFFAVHPLNTQAVAWIPGRNDPLLAVPIMLSAICFIDFIRAGGKGRLAFSLLFFALALTAKESAVMLPLAMAGYALLVPKTGWKSKKLWTHLSLALAVIAAWYWLRAGAMGFSPEWQGNRITSPVEFIFMMSSYLGKVFLPIKLSPVAVPQLPAILIGAAAAVILLAASFYKGIGNKPVFRFGLLWLTVFSLPYLVRGSFVTLFLEHRFYLPLMGLLISLTQVRILQDLFGGRRSSIVITLIIALMLYRTIGYSAVFKDRQTFWDQAEKTSPESSLVLYNKGLMYQEQKNYDLAAEKYLLALKYTPDYAGVHNNLGMVYQAVGEYAKAEAQYRQAIKFKKDFARAHDNLGSLYCQLGSPDRAKQEFSQAIAISDLPSAHNNLGSLYYNQGDNDRAGEEFLKAVRLDPDLAPARVNLGSYYLKNEQAEKARQEYLKALELDPRNADASYNLSLIYSETGRYDLAEDVLREALKANPAGKMLHFQLSSVYFLDGKYPESVNAYDRYLEAGGQPDQDILARLKPFRKDTGQ